MANAAPSVRGEALALGIAMVYPTVAAWLYFRTFAGAAWMPAFYAVAKVVQFALPLAWWRHGGPGTWQPRSRGGAWWIGGATGAAIVALVVGAWYLSFRGSPLAAFAAPRIAARVEAVGAGTLMGFLFLATFLSLAHSLLEEYYWRWFVHGRLRARMSAGPAILVSSLSFGAHHVVIVAAFAGLGQHLWATLLLPASVAAAGALWAWLYERSRWLGPAWLSHALADVAIFVVAWDILQ